MDFLTSLYSNENFGIILFTSVSILVLAFLIILFFGKKDQKERNLAKEQTNNESKNETNIKSEVAFDPIESVSSIEIATETKTSDALSTENDLNPVKLEENKEETIEMNELSNQEEIDEVPMPPKSDFDFDALAASISKELESIGLSEDTFVAEPNPYLDRQNSTSNYEVEKEELENKNMNLNLYEPPKQTEPTVEMTIEPEIKTENMDPNIAMPNPTQFSSVYVNNKLEEENTREETQKAPMELPKKIELPKLNPEVAEKKEFETPNMMFPSLENEIPTYNDENRK